MRNGKYILIVAPNDYPGKKYRKRYIYEHHYVWWKHTSITLPNGYNIHHKNENPHDNRFENLELISKQTHCKIHKVPENKWVALICDYCKKPFQRLKRYFLSKKSIGQTRFYCCKRHQVIDQMKRRHKRDKIFITLECQYCKKDFERRINFYKAKKKNGQNKFFCCKSHSTTYYNKLQNNC